MGLDPGSHFEIVGYALLGQVRIMLFGKFVVTVSGLALVYYELAGTNLTSSPFLVSSAFSLNFGVFSSFDLLRPVDETMQKQVKSI